MLRLKSLGQLGKNVKVVSDTGVSTARKRSPSYGLSVPQERLWRLVKIYYPDAELEVGDLVDGRKYTVDILIRRINLCIEVDGWAYHGKFKKGFLRDREKDRALMLSGYRVVRFTAGEILKTTDLTLSVLHQVVAMLEKEKGAPHGQTNS